MKPIKFRAWDKTHQKMFYDVSIRENYFCVYRNNEGLLSISGRIAEKSSIIIMQFTGLCDKNKVEIYEGDICKWKNQISKKEYQGSIWLIVWDKVHAKFTTKYKGGGKSSDSIFPLFTETDMEVIGNVHEHPELLEKNNG